MFWQYVRWLLTFYCPISNYNIVMAKSICFIGVYRKRRTVWTLLFLRLSWLRFQFFDWRQKACLWMTFEMKMLCLITIFNFMCSLLHRWIFGLLWKWSRLFKSITVYYSSPCWPKDTKDSRISCQLKVFWWNSKYPVWEIKVNHWNIRLFWIINWETCIILYCIINNCNTWNRFDIL